MNKKQTIISLIVLSILVMGSQFILYNIGNKHPKELDNEKLILLNSYNSERVDIRLKDNCLELREAKGKSMLPSFEERTLLVLDKCYNPKKLKEGDSITFQDRNSITNHRIIWINHKDKTLQTKGDNNNANDFKITFDKIYAKNIGVLNILNG